MDTEQNEIVEQGTEQADRFEKRQYIAVTVMLVLLAILLTFVITYAALTNSYSDYIDEMESEYQNRLDLLGDFSKLASIAASNKVSLFARFPKNL